MTMEPVDGNAIAGQLLEAFGVEMTTVIATCRFCGRSHPLAEARVYTSAPGAVARCCDCGEVTMVTVDTGARLIIHVSGCELAGFTGETLGRRVVDR